LCSKFFFEVRPTAGSKMQSSKSLGFLWVTQEILKALPPNPPWSPRNTNTTPSLPIWNDAVELLSQTTENTQLILRHARLILSYQSTGAAGSKTTKVERSTDAPLPIERSARSERFQRLHWQGIQRAANNVFMESVKGGEKFWNIITNWKVYRAES